MQGCGEPGVYQRKPSSQGRGALMTGSQFTTGHTHADTPMETLQTWTNLGTLAYSHIHIVVCAISTGHKIIATCGENETKKGLL